MRAPDKIPPAVRQMQSDVSNPAVSAWVAANAGSGKTHVLARRVINLLLDDVAPEIFEQASPLALHRCHW